MTTTTESPDVRRYLGELRRLLGDAPDHDLVVEGVERHIEDALGGSTDPRRVRAVLDELGDPAAIAAEAVPMPAPAPRFLDGRAGAALTVLLLAFGGIVLPVVGWIAGVVLLWSSRGWTVPDKVIGTLAIPVIGPVLGIAGAAAAGGTVLPAHLLIIAGIPSVGILLAVYLLLRFRPAR